MIQVTEKAITQIQRIIAESAKGNILRLSVVGGGCSGMSYKMDLDQATTDKDKVLEFSGVKIAIDPKSFLFLQDITLDFDNGLNGKGFTFENPKAKKSCGCGNSFSA